MSWGTILKSVYVSRVRKDDAADKLRRAEEELASIRRQICAFAAATPAAQDGQTYGEAITELADEVDTALDAFRDEAIDAFLCALLAEAEKGDYEEV